MKNIDTRVIFGAIVIAVVFFFVGDWYGNKNVVASPQQTANGFNRNRAGGMARGGNGAPTAGIVLSKDATSITVALREGGSRIIFYNASTTIMKTTPGSIGDITASTSVMINGQTNPDGSVTAQSIQIRP